MVIGRGPRGNDRGDRLIDAGAAHNAAQQSPDGVIRGGFLPIPTKQTMGVALRAAAEASGQTYPLCRTSPHPQLRQTGPPCYRSLAIQGFDDD